METAPHTKPRPRATEIHACSPLGRFDGERRGQVAQTIVISKPTLIDGLPGSANVCRNGMLLDFVVVDAAKEAMLKEVAFEEVTCVDHKDMDERRLRVSRPDGQGLGTGWRRDEPGFTKPIAKMTSRRSPTTWVTGDNCMTVFDTRGGSRQSSCTTIVAVTNTLTIFVGVHALTSKSMTRLLASRVGRSLI